MHLNGMDLVILTILILSTLLGMVRGFLMEIVCLIPWALALTIAIIFTPVITQKLLGPGAAANSHYFLMFIVTFVPVFMLAMLGAHITKSWMKDSGASRSGTNKVLGMIYGFIRGLLIVLLVIVGANSLGPTGAGWVKGSKLGGALGNFISPIIINNNNTTNPIINNIINNNTTNNIINVATCIVNN